MRDFPKELKQLALPDLEALAQDLRQEILRVCLAQGGHLGASLGAVELAIAAHTVFESPREPVIWDVGHQAYAHKLLTGRAERFPTLRQRHGLSGFLSRAESAHDVFGAGHSSTSLSAALAFAWARRETRDWTVAVIGDGGLTAGMAWEALQQLRAVETGPLLIVVNDNQMSIGPNVGAVPHLLSSPEAATFFGEFGLRFVGPVDGHRLEELSGLFGDVKRGVHGDHVLVHVLTQKGKGYAPAEERPEVFHGVAPVRASAKLSGTVELAQETFSSVAGRTLCDLAASDERIVAVTAAMAEGTGLLEFAQKFPTRFFDVGIAEQHAVTFAAALAAESRLPVVAIYSTFLQRAYDQVIHDVALQGLPVTFLVDRAGLVGQDGPTHHGAFDLAYLSAVPGLEIWAPATAEELESMLAARFAPGSAPRGPLVIRYPRGRAPRKESVPPASESSDRADLLVVAVGAAHDRAAAALGRLVPEERARVRLLSWTRLAPVQADIREAIVSGQFSRTLLIEDGTEKNGVSAALLASFSGRVLARVLALPHRFVEQGSVPELERELGLDRDGILAAIRGELEGLRP